jgi:hypothetical protein
VSVPPFEKSGWSISYVIVQWRRGVVPLLRKAEKTEDPKKRAKLMREAAKLLEGKAKALRRGARLALGKEE